MPQQNSSSLSRRRLLQTSLLAGLGAALANPLRAAERKPPVIYKAIPSTGEKIPVIGIGTNQFTNTDYPIVRDLLKRMHELGGTLINTASAYRDAEILIGKALRELDISKEMFVSTMFDAPGVNGMKDMTPGKESVERSFQRLGKIDLMFVHLAIGLETMMPILQDLKKQGRVRYIGITSVYHPNEDAIALEHLRRQPLDFIQLPYSLADRSIEKNFLPLAQERKVAVQAAIPFGGSRNLLFQQAANRKLPPWAADLGITTWAQYFLKWSVSHPAVTCAVPGSTKVSHLEDNQGAGLGRLPDPDERKRMEAFWVSKA
jgi:aryl-alcohol dehydrogenase-like predicted oxidoreductase